MKSVHAILSSILLLSLLIAFDSCKKDNDSAPENTIPVDTTFVLKAIVNGNDFVFSKYTATLYFSKQDSHPIFQIHFYDTVTQYDQYLSLFFYDTNYTPQLKTYYYRSNAQFGLFQGGISSFTENSGQVTLLKYDYVNKKISGTFSFELSDMNESDSIITVTGGIFSNIDYTLIR